MCECPKTVPEDPQYEENLPCLLLYAEVAFTETLRLPRRRVHLSVKVRGADDDEPEPGSPERARSADGAVDDRRARRRRDRLTIGWPGALEVFRLAERKDVVPDLSTVDSQVWRAQFERSGAQTYSQRIVEAQHIGIGVLILGDQDGRQRSTILVIGGHTFCGLVALPRSWPDRSVSLSRTGVRAATSYGEHVAEELASDIADAERTVVAGGAYGIEGAAHRATLASGGDTIVVMANGVDRPYPMGHRELFARVADLGLMVSEVPPGAVPTRHRFLTRARLMAALSATTVVVEAGARSSSMTVARHAHELGRTVGAVPGPVTSVTSAGPHQL